MGRGLKKCSGCVGCCGGLNWVHCDVCNRLEMYENCGFQGKFDVKKMKKQAFVCRMCELVSDLSSMAERVCSLEDKVKDLSVCLERVKDNGDGVNNDDDSHVSEESLLENARQMITSTRLDVLQQNVACLEQVVKVVMKDCVSVKKTQAEAGSSLAGIGLSMIECQEKVNAFENKLLLVEGNLTASPLRIFFKFCMGF